MCRVSNMVNELLINSETAEHFFC